MDAVPDRSAAWRGICAAAGPLLIAAAVLVTLRAFAFEGLITNEHPDILSFWLPRWTFLGRSLALGHLPLWNPYEMLGYRFAADPQSGWTYLPPMLLFSALRPGAAMAAMIVLHPVLAGIATYAFLRSEGLSRAPATLGGLGVAMLISSSELAISMPFSGFLAWTAVTLACLSRLRRADRWSRRIAWLGATALGWSQVADAHMSHGLAMSTLLVVAYLAAHGIADVRRGDARARLALGRALLVLVVLPVAALAVLLPRLSLIRDSSLAGGYDRLGAGVRSVAGIDERPIQANGVWAGWPFGFAAAPGAYAGASALLCVPAAVRARRHRALVAAVGGSLVLAWVLMLNGVVTASWFREVMQRIPFGDAYVHNPGRLRMLAVFAIPVLAAIGLQGLLDRPVRLRTALLWAASAGLLAAGVPLLAGGRIAAFWFVLAALPVGAAGARRRSRRRAPGGRRDRRRAARRGLPDRPGGGRAPQPRAPAAAAPEALDAGVPPADVVRPPDRQRPVPHVGAAGVLLREGLPVRAGSQRLAGARDGARDALRAPRRAGLQPGAARALLDVHPRHQRTRHLLQRVGDPAPLPPGPAAHRHAVPGRPRGRLRPGSSRARPRGGDRAGLRPRGGRGSGGPRLGRDRLEDRGLHRLGTPPPGAPRLRSGPHGDPGRGPGDRASPHDDGRAGDLARGRRPAPADRRRCPRARDRRDPQRV